jgi:SnoaL-like polyketide cyclase
MTDMPAIGWSRGRRGREAVTIISHLGAAGSGKTSLLHAWPGQPGQDHRIALMSVWPGQRGAQLFWLALLGAVRAATGGAECRPDGHAATPGNAAAPRRLTWAPATGQPPTSRSWASSLPGAPSGPSPTTSGASKPPWWPVAGMSRTSPPCRWTGAPSPSHPGREKSCCRQPSAPSMDGPGTAGGGVPLVCGVASGRSRRHRHHHRRPLLQPWPDRRGYPLSIRQGRIGDDVFSLHSAFPDLDVIVADMFAEHDKVVTRVIARGTHLGPLYTSRRLPGARPNPTP